MPVALDTETTGLTLHHGCKPFFISCCDEAEELTFWEWDVDPKTREPIIPKRDRKEVRQLVLDPNVQLVFHNAKFDVRALMKAGVISFPEALTLLSDCEETLIASHCLSFAESHKLKDLALMFLDIGDDDQQKLKKEITKARRIGKKKGWRVAASEDPHWPHLKRAPKDVGWGAFDSWLPLAIAKADGYPEDHHWRTVLQTYGLQDAERTIGLWLLFREALTEEDLWGQYETRKKLLPITFRMEERGISINPTSLQKAVEGFIDEEEAAEVKCFRLANGKLDNLRSYPQLQGVLFGPPFKLKPSRKFRTKTGYSVAHDALEEMKLEVKTTSKAWHFMNNLQAFRKTGKAVDYLESYQSIGLPIMGTGGGPRCFFREGSRPKTRRKDRRKTTPAWLLLHPNFNVTGTKTTRFSSDNPNAQNISKQERFNLRQVFCPLPGRVWYAADFSNIELRIFAFESGDKKLIQAFESGLSVHLVIAEQLHPKLYARLGPEAFKKTEQYRWVKNGDFALIYGAGIARANATYRVANAYQRIRKQLPLIDAFMESKYSEGKQKGFITTLGGYRLQVPKDKPHAAVNYFVQGSAGWALILAMIRVDEYLQRLGPDYRMIMTVHDELVFDFPKRKDNLPRVRRIRSLMERSGEDLGFPLPVDVDKIETNWANGKALK
jgi:DNA polymerase I-like protein with 3'-5' exonuclease and polymerase domains